MAKINLLSEELRNRISAGEVIDRPYSVVKELIENSIDAGATEIEIAIERGGKDLIKITDNGCGIEEDDMRSAFIAHATSKISDIDDLDRICTLGFRGEALASIASISKIEMHSSVDGIAGNSVECDDGYIGKVRPASCQKGTQISIKNIFYNTPVRYKYMKSDKKEESDITTCVIGYILGNPQIAFKYYVDGKLSLQSYGGGLEEAITQIYGANVLPNCFKLCVERNDMSISGFIGNQNYFKSNKTYQSVYLNGRKIVNSIISSAIANAYSPYAMKRQYPFYILFIKMAEDTVDVNVHPNKSDVRFMDNSKVYGTLYKVISGVLDGTAKAAEFVVDSERSEINETKPEQVPYAAAFTQSEMTYDTDFSDCKGIEQFVKFPEKPKKTEESDSPYGDWEAPDFSAQVPPQVEHYYPYVFEDKNKKEFDFNKKKSDPLLLGQINKLQKELEAEQLVIEYKQCKYRGTLFNTYLLYEIEDEVYIIDQHAAHERLLYDKLIAKLGKEKLGSQRLIIPHIFAVNAEEKEFISNNLKFLTDLGFIVDDFGDGAVRINAIPANLPNFDAEKFFDEFLTKIGEWKKIEEIDIVKDSIAQAACKHAVKGGDVLTEEERENLFSMLKGNMGLKCPHGRPICVKLTQTALEKMFKRKV